MKTIISIDIDVEEKHCGESCFYFYLDDFYPYFRCNLFEEYLEKDGEKRIRCEECIKATPINEEKYCKESCFYFEYCYIKGEKEKAQACAKNFMLLKGE